MKKIILLIIVSWIGLKLSAQSFDTYIRDSERLFPLFNAIELPNHEYVIGVNTYNTTSKKFTGTNIYKFSSNGTVLDTLALPYVVGNLMYFHQKIYFSGTNLGALDEFIIGTIDPVQFDTTAFNTHQTSFRLMGLFGLTYSEVCNCMMVSGGGFDTTNVQNALIFQFDTTLNIQQEKAYQPWSTDTMHVYGNMFYNVLDNPTEDGYWALSRSSLDTTKGWKHGGIATVVPLDSNLVRDSTQVYQLHSNKYFQGATLGIREEPFDGVRLTDSTYLFAGTVVDMGRNSGKPYTENSILLLVTDTNLNTLKHEFYGKKDTFDLGAWNMVDRNEDYVYIFHTSGNYLEGIFENFFGLTKVDEAGNRLWTHYYNTPDFKETFSVTATSDGGALMVGSSFFIDKNGKRHEDAYILKVDSNGDRPLPTDVSQTEISADNYRIFPNPAKDILNLLKINRFRPYRFELYDAFGRLVKKVEWKESHQQINVSDLASGMYIYRITDEEGRRGSGKVVVE